MSEQPQNLMEGLLEEIERVKELVVEYKSIPKKAGALAALMLEQQLANARLAIVETDVIKMLYAYNELKECE